MNIYLNISIVVLLIVLIFCLVVLGFKIKPLISKEYTDSQTTLHTISVYLLLTVSILLLIGMVSYMIYEREKFYENKTDAFVNYGNSISRIVLLVFFTLFLSLSGLYLGTSSASFDDKIKNDQIIIYTAMVSIFIIIGLLFALVYIDFIYMPSKLRRNAKQELLGKAQDLYDETQAYNASSTYRMTGQQPVPLLRYKVQKLNNKLNDLESQKSYYFKFKQGDLYYKKYNNLVNQIKDTENKLNSTKRDINNNNNNIYQ